MFSFHKPKIYRSNSGCCICRAKSSSSRFTDSKKYEPEFERCFRIDEKRTGEICNACVLLVKRWKKLPSGTTKDWHHVVDARAGPGTKSFKNKSSSADLAEKKRRVALAKARSEKLRLAKSMTSSSSEEEEDEDEDEIDDLDEPMDEIEDSRSVRRSTRLSSPGSIHTSDYLLKRRKTLQLVSFLDASFWKKQKVCCGIIFKGPNNEVLVYPELLRPCGCRPTPPPSLVTSAASSTENLSDYTTSSTISPQSSPLSSPQKNLNSLHLATSPLTGDMPESLATSLKDSPSPPSPYHPLELSCGGDDSTPDSDSAISDRLSTVSSSLLTDDLDGSSSMSESYDSALAHHEIEMAKAPGMPTPEPVSVL